MKHSQFIVSPRPASRLEQGPRKSKRGSFAGMHFLSVLHQPSQKLNRKKIKRKPYRAFWLRLSQINSLSPASQWSGDSVQSSGAGRDAAAVTSNGHHCSSPSSHFSGLRGLSQAGPTTVKAQFSWSMGCDAQIAHQVKS